MYILIEENKDNVRQILDLKKTLKTDSSRMHTFQIKEIKSKISVLELCIKENRRHMDRKEQR